MAGRSVVKQEGGKKILVIDFRGSAYGPDVARYPQAMKDVIEKLSEVEADEVVLSEYYERIYDEKQTNLLKGIAALISRWEEDTIWSPSHLGKSTESRVLSPRHDAVLRILNALRSDPFKAYLELLSELKTQVAKLPSLNPQQAEDLKIFVNTLQFMRQSLEETRDRKSTRLNSSHYS